MWVVGRAYRGSGVARRVRQSLTALTLNSVTSLVAGAVLGSLTGTFERVPGLLVLVPAAIGLRGNIFSTFGSRTSTAIHTGEFELSLRSGTVLRQNVEASMVLTAATSVVLALLAWAAAAVVRVDGLASPLELVTISVLGGLLASLVVLAASLALVAGAVRFGWDLDDVVAPVVSTLGDVLTLPALWLATALVGIRWVPLAVGTPVALASVAALVVVATRSRHVTLRRITTSSWPVLVVAALFSTLAGLALEQRLVALTAFPALLMLQPAFVSSAGALGGIVSSRAASKLHLGLVAPTAWPQREVRGDVLLTFVLFVPAYVINGIGAHLVAGRLGQASPGLGTVVAVALLGGLAAVAFATAVAYYATIATFTAGVDPDTYAIPVVTSAVDFGGVLCLLTAATLVGVSLG